MYCFSPANTIFQFSAEWSRAAVETSLVAQVAAAWFELADLDHELSITRATLASREESLRLIRDRQARGVGDLLDVRRAETLVETAARQIPLLEEQVAKTEDALRFLSGRDPGPVTRGSPLVEQRVPAELPLGATSALLDRRPDVRAAEALAAEAVRIMNETGKGITSLFVVADDRLVGLVHVHDCLRAGVA